MAGKNREKREARSERRFQHEAANTTPTEKGPTLEYTPAALKPLEALNDRQATHKTCLFNDDFVVAIGAAGTGKTFLSACVAAEIYKQRGVKRLILTRPNVDVGESFGYLPGDLTEKYAPYLEPFQDAIISRIGSDKWKCDLNKNIQPKPLQFMRGKTFDDAIMLLDEAQNTTVAEMKMFITRIGINTRVFISGDSKQCDLKLRPGEMNGLEWLVKKFRQHNSRHEIIEYTKADCVRSGLALEMLNYIEEDYAA